MSDRPASEGVRLFRQALQGSLDDHLEQFAEEWEEDTRNERDWRDDTGSAADAITAYVVGIGDPRKNFGSIAWGEAQRSGSEKYGNPPRNYRPHVEFIEVGEGLNRKVVILTNFVPYAGALEFGGRHGLAPFGGNLLSIMAEMHEEHFLMRIASAITEALRTVATG